MAITNIIGFDTRDDVAETYSPGGTYGYATGRLGGYAFRAYPTTTATGYCFVPSGVDAYGVNDVASNFSYARFWFKPVTLPSADEEAICSDLGAGWTIRITSAGILKLYQSTSTLRATGTTALVAGTWYRIEIKAVTGSFELKIGGTSELAYAATLGSGPLCLGKVPNINGRTVDFYYDDVEINSTGYPGDGAVAFIYPNDDVSNGWVDTVGSSELSVDDWKDGANDGDTTIITESTVDTVAAMDYTSMPSSPTSIAAVKLMSLVKDANQTNTYRLDIISNGSTVSTTTLDGGATYGLRSLVAAVDPSGGGAWTEARVNAIKGGPYKTQSQNRVITCTALGMYVEYVPGVTGPAALKTIEGTAKSAVKTIQGTAIGAVKTLEGLA